MTTATYQWGRKRGVGSQRGFHVGGGMIPVGFLEEVAFELSHEGWSGFFQKILEKVGRKGIPGRGNSVHRALEVRKGLCQRRQ